MNNNKIIYFMFIMQLMYLVFVLGVVTGDYIYKLMVEPNNCDNDHLVSIHGFWPDYRNGSYPQYCHMERECSVNSGCSRKMGDCSLDVRDYMYHFDIMNLHNTWCSYKMSGNLQFWCHEWCKHGCCTSMNISEYFNKTMSLFINNYVNKSITYPTCYVKYLDDTFVSVDCP